MGVRACADEPQLWTTKRVAIQPPVGLRQVDVPAAHVGLSRWVPRCQSSPQPSSRAPVTGTMQSLTPALPHSRLPFHPQAAAKDGAGVLLHRVSAGRWCCPPGRVGMLPVLARGLGVTYQCTYGALDSKDSAALTQFPHLATTDFCED